MHFDYTKIPMDKAYELRKRFIDTFVDTSCEHYVKYIRDLKVNEPVNGEGLIVSHLWSCLKKDNKYLVDFYSAMRYLYQRKNERVFVMWDIRPEKVLYPEHWPKFFKPYIPEYEILLKSDEMISIEPKELCEVLLHDHHMEKHRIVDINRSFLREDVYVFDETFTWYIAPTHEEYTTHNEKRVCFSNVRDIDPLVL